MFLRSLQEKNHTIFLKEDGTVWATGINGGGQLGDGTLQSSSAIVQVNYIYGISTNPLTNISAISTGYNHSIFLKNDGTVWATGSNSDGQLGDGSTTDRTRAVQVMQSNGNPLTNILAVGADAADPKISHSINTIPAKFQTHLLNISIRQPIQHCHGSDANTTFSYSLIAGAGDGNNSLFTLESNGTLKTAALLDFETSPSLSIRVQVSDENNASIDGNFTVLVTNENEAPTNLTSSGVFTLAENQATGTAVGSFTATDPDAGASLSFSLVDDNMTSYSKFSFPQEVS